MPTLTKEKLEEMRIYLETVLAGFDEHFDVMTTIGKMIYSTNNFTVKLSSACIGEDGLAETKEAIAFKNNARFQGLDPELFNKTFNSNGKEFKISGFRTSARKYPILAVSTKDGKTYKFTVNQIKKAFVIPVSFSIT